MRLFTVCQKSLYCLDFHKCNAFYLLHFCILWQRSVTGIHFRLGQAHSFPTSSTFYVNCPGPLIWMSGHVSGFQLSTKQLFGIVFPPTCPTNPLNSVLDSSTRTSSSVFVFIENFIQHTFPAKRQYTGIVVVHCCYTEDFKLEKIKLRCDSAGHLCTALFNKTKPMQLVLKRKKKKSKCNRRKSSMVHQERKEKEKTLHTRNMDTWLLLYPTTKACVSL